MCQCDYCGGSFHDDYCWLIVYQNNTHGFKLKVININSNMKAREFAMLIWDKHGYFALMNLAKIFLLRL